MVTLSAIPFFIYCIAGLVALRVFEGSFIERLVNSEGLRGALWLLGTANLLTLPVFTISLSIWAGCLILVAFVLDTFMRNT